MASGATSTGFVLNQPQYAGATILLAGARFGTGSSREHAVWALMDYGFEAVVASSFGDIFANNSSKQGLVTVRLDATDVDELDALVREDPTTLLVVDVTALVVEVPATGWHRTFDLDPMIQERLVEGWDDVALSLRRADAIAAYERTSTAPSLAGIFDTEGHVR